MGLKKGALLKSWAITMLFQTEIYAIKAYIMESIKKGYTGRDIYIISNSRNHQALCQLPDKFQISLGLPSIPGKTDRI